MKRSSPRRWPARLAAFAVVLGAALLAHAVGNGDIKATTPVTAVTVTSTTGSGTGTATLQNTTSATTYNVLVGSDATCDPLLGFSISGGNPIIGFGPLSSRSIQLNCPPRAATAMRRCLYHATNSANGTPLADFESVCIYGTGGTLMPQLTLIDFGSVQVGDEQTQTLAIRNDGASPITRVYLQADDIDGNFRFSTPCNPDAAFCDEDLTAAVTPGSDLAILVKCTPQTAGTHSAQVFVGTNTFQLLSTGVTLECVGTAATPPVLGANPTNIDIQALVEVTSGSASTTVHLSNAGGGTLLVNDVRTVDVDTGTAADWTYNASGACTGQIHSTCSLDSGDPVDINLTFDPSAIGRRRATLLISYHDTIDRTKEIALDGVGLGATLKLVDTSTTFPLGMVPIGRTAQLDFTLANTGNRDTTAMFSLTPATTPPFTLSPATMAIVTPTVQKAATIACAPTTAGAFSTQITAQADDTLVTTPLVLTATCEGTSFDLYASPSTVQFGELRIGSSTLHRTVSVLSDSGAQLTLSGQPELEVANANITLGTLSSQTTPASFDVAIDAPIGSESQISATILVKDSAGNTIKIPLGGRIVRASYEVNPEVELGTFCVGQSTTSSNLSLVSDGTASIALMQPTLAKTPSPFELSFTSPSLYPSTLLGAGAATLAVTPKRQTVVTTVSDTLTWRTDVAGELTATTAVSAQFIDRGGAIAPPALDFGKVTAHLFSDDGQRVMIQNCNDTPLVLDPPMIQSPFSIDSPNFPAMLDPNETVTFSVGFHPTRKGPVSDTLRISSPQLPDAPLEVTLFGEGFTPEDVMPDAGTGSNHIGDTSFYACSCSSNRPVGGIPIVLALAWVLVPRRKRAS